MREGWWGVAVEAAEGHLCDKYTCAVELKGAVLTRTWMTGLKASPPL